MKDLEKPWYRSKMCVVYVMTLAATVYEFTVVAFLPSPHPSLGETLETFAFAVAGGLAALLGMKGWADKIGVEKIGAEKAPPPEA